MRHYSSIASNFINLTLRDEIDILAGRDCPINGLEKLSVSTIDFSSEPVSFTLLDVFYVLNLAQ